ncbi:MAG: hypothetical protein K2Q07_07515 [Burkholderiaceae bacterium]|nr:hypothetical protein [Burkholderiaceae bacterium]
MSAAELWLLAAGCAACVTAVSVVRAVRERAAAAREWMPGELKNHRLAYSERTFRSGGDKQVVARVDRAYRGRNGLVTLVELKTRRTDRAYLSDVIELSAQRIALAGETGEPVDHVGWVVVESGVLRTAHRVTLMSAQAVWDLASRREALLAGAELASYPRTSAVCTSCAYRGRCRLRRHPHDLVEAASQAQRE